VADAHPEIADRLRETARSLATDLSENARPVGRVE